MPINLPVLERDRDHSAPDDIAGLRHTFEAVLMKFASSGPLTLPLAPLSYLSGSGAPSGGITCETLSVIETAV
jgi:hypothetical protein